MAEQHKNVDIARSDRREAFVDQLSSEPLLSVHKFGGSSLASFDRLNRVAQLIKDYTQAGDCIVVSANGDMTDWLLEFIEGDQNRLETIKRYYQELIVSTLLVCDQVLQQFYHDLTLLEQFNCEHNACSNGLKQAQVLAFGEVWSARLLTALLNENQIPATAVDARELLKTDQPDNYQSFDPDHYRLGIKKVRYGNFGKRLVVTGFIASDTQGQTITLGRNGSDYSATLLARFARAKQVVLWTDVAGIFNADPRLIDTAEPIKRLSYALASSLAAVGSGVLHQKTISPLLDSAIPLQVKSSLLPQASGTWLVAEQAEYIEQQNYPGQPCHPVVVSLAVNQGGVVLVGYQLRDNRLFLQGLQDYLQLNRVSLQWLEPEFGLAGTDCAVDQNCVVLNSISHTHLQLLALVFHYCFSQRRQSQVLDLKPREGATL